MNLTFKPLVVAALVALASHAQARSFDQVGAAPQQLEPVGTYAIDSPVREGLKSLVPAGWQIFVHREVKLPASMAWAATDTWPMAMASLAQASGITALVDWDKRSVFFKPQALALNDAVTRTQVTQAAVTPLPSLSVAPTATTPVAAPALAKQVEPPVAAVDRATVDALTTKLAALEGELTKLGDSRLKTEDSNQSALAALRSELDLKTVALDKAQGEAGEALKAAHVAQELARVAQERAEQASQQALSTAPAEARVVAAAMPMPMPARMPLAEVPTAPVSELSEPAPAAAPASRTAAQAFNRTSVKTVAAQVAQTHDARLDVHIPEDLKFEGPVTLLGVDLGEDVRLMLRALGPDSQVSFEVCRQPAYVRVVPAFAGAVSRYAETACSHPALQMAAANQPSVLATPVAPVAKPVVSTNSTDAAYEKVDVVTASPAPMPMPALVSSALQFDTATKAATSLVKETAIAKPALRLEVPVGADFESTLGSFLSTQGYSLRWDADASFEADDPLNAEGADLVEVLTQVLPKLGLEAEINTQERIVRVGEKRNFVKN